MYGMRTSLDLSGMPRPSSAQVIVEVCMNGIDLPFKRKGTGEYEGKDLIGSGFTINVHLGNF